MAALALALALTVPDPAAAEVAAAVPDGATLVLADGTAVRLSGIEPGPGAAAALRGLALGREVALEADGAARDRYGRRVAQVRRADGLWLQAALVERGLARVRGAADHRGALRPLLAVEAAARAARRGGWAGEGWAVLPAGPAVGPADSFQIVEGTVLRTARVQGVFYLNFGADWRRDFTVAVAARDRRAFAEAGLDPVGLAGRRLRVRGLVVWRNGPQIEATHPEQVEVLE